MGSVKTDLLAALTRIKQDKKGCSAEPNDPEVGKELTYLLEGKPRSLIGG